MSRRKRVERENDEYFQFARRIMVAAGKRVGQGDTVDLAGLVAVRREMEAVEVAAVAMMRDRHGYSWSQIGRDLGITRQAAQQYYGRRMAERPQDARAS